MLFRDSHGWPFRHIRETHAHSCYSLRHEAVVLSVLKQPDSSQIYYHRDGPVLWQRNEESRCLDLDGEPNCWCQLKRSAHHNVVQMDSVS